MAVVEYEVGDGNFNVELVPISRGEAIFRGRYYSVPGEATTKEK
tara:strand:+ start:410 stop:541 length:132 start_codon:yes stop_codon:yes gene_type:complete